MKKILILLFVFISTTMYTLAQETPTDNKGERQEKIEALYVAYITKELNLTAEDAQKFWPVHTQFTTELKSVKRDLPELERQQAVLNVKKKYQDKFNSIIGTERTQRFFKIGDEFRRKLLERLRKQRQQRQQEKGV
jgi:hypothetical protein